MNTQIAEPLTEEQIEAAINDLAKRVPLPPELKQQQGTITQQEVLAIVKEVLVEAEKMAPPRWGPNWLAEAWLGFGGENPDYSTMWLARLLADAINKRG